MAIRTSRVLAASIALVAAALLLLWWNARERPVPVDPNDAPWIGLPKSGMDATQWPVRQALNESFISGDRYSTDSLAVQCGSESQTVDLKERYAALIGNGWWGPYWRITMDVHGERVDIAVRDGLFPPPPPPSSNRDRESSLVSPTLNLQKSRMEMERVRALWNDPALWHAPQERGAFSCRDGDPVFLEACVNGRYAARWRNCNAPAMDATVKLWRAFNELLPPPPKPEWRDESGNPIPNSSSH